ncbi:MAG: DegT/DnrJ/EryC1/StrS family aminotransferase, partial [Deltaproteobacteria bacterium]|nr:DegT/DnrJ/EryC1/StrS family aminotransferase [Deltaproteobacteria bacterium]
MIRIFDYLSLLPEIETEVMDAVRSVLRSGRLILGPETEAFESEFADYTGAVHCIGVSSGTTALHLAMFSLGIGPGDEVITVANTCVPTVSAIALTGARPVFVDVCERFLTMEPQLAIEAVTDRTKCILPVHLWGQPVRLEELQKFSADTGLPRVEDCAQSLGARGPGGPTGT